MLRFLKSKKGLALMALTYQWEIINLQINKMCILLVMRVKEIK